MAKKRKISIVTDIKKDHKTLPVNGAWGGMSSSGTPSTLIVNFHLDMPTTPNITEIEVDENGRADFDKGEHITRGEITRQVQATLSMSPMDAIIMGQWLVQKGNEGVKILKESLR